VPGLLRLCERHDAWLMLDDAHGFGVLGSTGGGVLQHCGAASKRIVYMATLGKAAGVFGAFVAGEADVIETLLQRARPYIYTTALPPLLACTVLASLGVIAAEPWRRARLAQLVHQLRHGATGLRWRLMPSDTAIQPLLIGDNDEAMQVSESLAARGILVPAIRPPTVPQGSARLRISLSAGHSEEDVAQLVDALRDIGRV
jgi:8-amino-7-oxononanoate synthase